MLLQIADILPREQQGIFACCNPIPPLVRQFLPEIHSFILEAREAPLFKVGNLNGGDTTKYCKNIYRYDFKSNSSEIMIFQVSLPQEKKPSVYQHPRYDPAHLLNCPHDSSHITDGQDLPTIPGILSLSLYIF